jgi:hypothetical protein
MLGPLGVKRGRLGWDFDVLRQLAQDVAIPSLADIGQGLRGVEFARRQFAVKGDVHDETPKSQAKVAIAFKRL